MQQSMQISLLCSTEHKEENMIFINSPFAILDEAFRSLYPDKKYKACIEPSIKDDEGNRVFGFTQFSKGETPVIAISAELNIMFVGKASEKEMEQIDIALLIGLGIKLAGAENQSGGGLAEI